ncbi:hypothetical protein JOC95_003976 [Bacillus tianshenii]|uniref:Uncharacterized protein n=1 Tax=Sutcliffiella tianshenii TaxID=1463404 RepID=A0ABS2P537_9BACI|nr:hypothetical protein [Bacillus tianshenii]MBM7622066.1 hypothetical protein [Bacillus tianshenii]
MTKTYTDYVNRIALSIPDQFIDVKTGNPLEVSGKIHEQLDYHANNSTLADLLLSALYEYFNPRSTTLKKGANQEILQELSAIKRMIISSYSPASLKSVPNIDQESSNNGTINMKEVDDILDAFGG